MKPIANLLLLCGPVATASTAIALEQQGFQRPIVDSHSAAWRTTQQSKQSSPPSYREPLLALHKSLVEIPSTTGYGGEDKVAYFLVDYLTKRGYTTQLQAVPAKSEDKTKRYNVLAWPGTSSSSDLPSSRKPRVLVTSHIDVVPPFIPYGIDAENVSDITSDTAIRGRGSVDAKASVAAQIVAVEALLAAGEVHPEDLMLLYVVGEETTGDGMKHFSASLRNQTPVQGFEAAIFGEPTGNKLACGHKGITGGWIRAKGKAGHSGYPSLGKSATELLLRALVKILDADLGSSDRFGNTTVNVGRLTGGVAGNVIAKDAGALVTARIAAGNFTTGHLMVKEKVWEILKETDEDAFTVDWTFGYGPVKCNCDIGGTFSQSLPPSMREPKTLSDVGFETLVTNYGTDVANLEGKHVSYLYGPGTILVAHGDNEALKVGDLEDAVEGIKKIIKHTLSQ